MGGWAGGRVWAAGWPNWVGGRLANLVRSAPPCLTRPCPRPTSPIHPRRTLLPRATTLMWPALCPLCKNTWRCPTPSSASSCWAGSGGGWEVGGPPAWGGGIAGGWVRGQAGGKTATYRGGSWAGVSGCQAAWQAGWLDRPVELSCQQGCPYSWRIQIGKPHGCHCSKRLAVGALPQL